MDTYSALQNSEKQMISVMKSVFGIKNLTASEFLSSTGKTVKLASDEVNDRKEVITLFCFDCNTARSIQDNRIIKDPLCFQFSLWVHQQHCGETTNMVHNISSPATSSQSSPKKATGMAYILGSGGGNLFHTPVWKKMSLLFNRQSNNVKVGYFEELEFLDNQKEFEKIFGDKPTIIPTELVSQDSLTAAKILYSYSEKCKLDVFLHMCQIYYVGHDSVDNYLIMQDVCFRVSYLRQEWRDRNGSTVNKILDDLSNTFLKISSSLPESAYQWPIQIYCAYYTALTEYLTKIIFSEKFLCRH